MCFALAGLELAAVMSGEIVDAEKTIPRATYISGFGIVFVYLVGTISLLVGLSSKDVNLVTGLVQAIQELEIKTGMRHLTNISALLVTIAGIGGAGAWLAGSARILFVTGIDSYLPKSFGKIHPKWKTPYVAIIFQGIIATVFLLMSLIGASTEQAYLVLVDATIIVYFIPYIYIFLAAIKVFRKESAGNGGRGSLIKTVASGIGGMTTIAAILLTLFPPAAGGSPVLFLVKTLTGSFAFVAVGIIIFWNSKRTRLNRSAAS
jgi:amino acid transporter